MAGIVFTACLASRQSEARRAQEEGGKMPFFSPNYY
jgi:hypothetical protein